MSEEEFLLALAFAPQNAHHHQVLALAVPQHRRAEVSLADEPDLFVGTNGAVVKAECDQVDAMQIQLDKTVPQNHVHGITAIAFAPQLALTNANRNPGGPVRAERVPKPDQADRAVVLQALNEK